MRFPTKIGWKEEGGKGYHIGVRTKQITLKGDYLCEYLTAKKREERVVCSPVRASVEFPLLFLVAILWKWRRRGERERGA